MEGIAAFALACNILQVIDCGFQVATTIYQIQRKGSSDGNDEIERRSEILLETASELRTSLLTKPRNQQSDAERRLLEISSRCSKNADKLRLKLSKLKSTGTWKDNILKGVKTVWSRDEISKLERALQADMAVMQAQLLSDLRQQQSAAIIMQQTNFQVLDTGLQNFIQQVASGFTTIQELIKATCQNSVQHNEFLHAETKQHVQNEHVVTRQEIHGNIDTVSARITAIQLSDMKLSQRERFLKSLRFPEMNKRKNEVSETYPDTYRWVFQQDRDQLSPRWDDFPEWLRNGDTRYWIQGSAGSGKSTLMKFILENLESGMLANRSANDSPIILSHFFWLAGSGMQNSLKGLLCSMLHQILTIDDQQLDRVLGSNSTHLSKESVSDWSTQALRQLLLSELSDCVKRRSVYVFLDGLDEFKHDGSFQDFFQFLNQLSSIVGIKLCMSSRPEQAFVNAFASKPGLKLHDMTHDDIARYISDRLMEIENENSCGLLSTVRSDMTRDLTDRAEGIFLWARLALEEVSRGLIVCQTPQSLQEWSRRIPKTVEALYESMLRRAGDNFDLLREEAALYFSIILLWKKDLIEKPSSSWCHDLFPTACNILIYAYLRHVHVSQSRHSNSQSFGDFDSIKRQCQQTVVRIGVACAGMLLVSMDTEDDAEDDQNDDNKDERTHTSANIEIQSARRLIRFCKIVKIRPIHRSVLDFLVDSPGGQAILDKCPLNEVDIVSNMLQGMLQGMSLGLRLTPYYNERIFFWDLSHDDELRRLAEFSAVRHLENVEIPGSPFLEVIRNVQIEFECRQERSEPVAEYCRPKKPEPATDWFCSSFTPAYNLVFDFTGFVIRYGLIEYIDGPYGFINRLARLKLRPTQDYLDYLLWMIVSCVSDSLKPLEPLELNTLWSDRASMIVTRLLELGANPNAGMCLHNDFPWKSTAWTVLLCNITVCVMNGGSELAVTRYWSICQVVYRQLLKARADLDARFVLIWEGPGAYSPARWSRPEVTGCLTTMVFFQLQSEQVIRRLPARSRSETFTLSSQARLDLIASSKALLVGKFRSRSIHQKFERCSEAEHQDILAHFRLHMTPKQPRGLSNEHKYRTVVKPWIEKRVTEQLSLLQQQHTQQRVRTGSWADPRHEPTVLPPSYDWMSYVYKYRVQLRLLRDAGFEAYLTATGTNIDFVYARMAQEEIPNVKSGLKELMQESVEVELVEFMIEHGFMGTEAERVLPRMSCPADEDWGRKTARGEVKDAQTQDHSQGSSSAHVREEVAVNL